MRLGTLLIVSPGELGTNVLEAAGRSGLFDRIVVGSRSIEKARGRIHNAMLGCGLEGRFPCFEAVDFDLNDPASARLLRSLDPDVVFCAPSLRPWWKMGGSDAKPSKAARVPFGGFVSLQLAPMAAFRDRFAESGVAATWVAASFPDVVNPSLWRSGRGPSFGVGNVQEPVPKLQILIGRELAVPPSDVKVKLVAQHAFEYFIFRDRPPDLLPPHRLKVTVHGEDQTPLGERVLREPFTFPYDLHFNRITASATIAALRALASQGPSELHLPGILGLVGGFPVVIEHGAIRLNVAPDWTEEDAVATNEASLPYDGLERIEADGTIIFTREAIAALRELTGATLDHVRPGRAADQAEVILNALN